MPIVVVKGSKAQSAEAALQRSDSDESVSARNAAKARGAPSDMSEVLGLRVYKISKPSFIDGSTTTALIGEDIFYRDEHTHTHTQTQTKTHTDRERDSERETAGPSLLQSIRAHKRVSVRERGQRDSLMEAVRENAARFKAVRAGQGVRDSLCPPSLQDALRWALEHAHAQEAQLAAHLLQLEERIAAHDAERSHCLPAVPQANAAFKGRFAGAKSSSQQENQKPKALSLLQQLEALKTQGTEAFLRSVCGLSDSKTQTSRSKFDPRPPNAQRAPSNSLEPSRPTQSKKHGAPSARHRVLRAASGGESETTSAAESELAQAASFSSKSPRLCESDADEMLPVPEADAEPEGCVDEETVAGEGERETVGSASERVAERESSTERQSVVHIDTDNSTTTCNNNENNTNQNGSNNDGVEDSRQQSSKDGEDTRSVERTDSPVAKQVTISSKTNGSKKKTRRPPPSVKYSNAKLDAHSASVDGKITAATQEAIDDMRRTQRLFMKSLGYTMGVFKDANSKQEQLERDTAKRLNRANTNGRRLFKGFEAFKDVKNNAESKASRICRDREYHRAIAVEARASIFVNDKENFGGVAGNVFDDMKRLRQVSKEWSQSRQIRLLLGVKWFVVALARLREYLRRMNNQAPMCVAKFLSILEELIYLDFSITVEIFYHLLLSEIFTKDDFRKNVVHQILDVVREGLGISPEDFVQFLESNDLQASPELMNLVRSNALASKAAQSGEREREREKRPVRFASFSVSTEEVVVHERALVPEEYVSIPEEESFPKRMIPIPPPIITQFAQTKNAMMISEDFN